MVFCMLGESDPAFCLFYFSFMDQFFFLFLYFSALSGCSFYDFKFICFYVLKIFFNFLNILILKKKLKFKKKNT